MSLQFHAAASRPVMTVLVGAIIAVLAAWGVWCLWRRRWRMGAMLLCAAAGPAVLAACLAADAVRQYLAGRRGAAKTLALAGALAAGLAVAAGVLTTAGGQAAWMALVGGETIVAIGVFYAAVYGHLGAGRLAVLMALRVGAVMALLAVLFKPAVAVSVDPQSLKPILPVLVDRSGSMATADEAGASTRLAQAVGALGVHRTSLESAFRPRWRPFGKTVEAAASFEALAAKTPSGEGSDGTDIALAIRRAAEESAKPRIPAMLLLTDGIHNGPDSPEESAARAAVPVYVVAVGSANPPTGVRNIRLAALEAPLEVARDSVASLRAGFQIDGLPGASVQVRLSDQGAEQPLASATLKADGPSAALVAELSWTAQGGTGAADQERVARLLVSAATDPAEAISEDNSSLLHVRITEPRIGVLYVEGSVRPEYKFLKRLLDADPQVQLATLVRISGSRFLSAGAIAGRNIQALPTRDEDFRGLDVLILGDLDRSFLSDAQISAMRRFVNAGGGLLMLGGHHSFGPGGYGGTDIEALLPVTVGGRNQPQQTSEFLPQLTSAGAAHPALVGMAGFFASPGRSAPPSAPPPLAGCVTVVAAKPAAMVLAVHPTQRNAAGPLVVLAVQQVGAGRTCAFTADTTWRWDLPMRALGAESPYQRFWGQLIRHLARSEVKTRRAKPSVLLRPERTWLRAGESLPLTVRALDSGGVGLEPSRVRCTLVPAGGAGQRLTLVAKSGGGLLEGTISPPAPGRYTLKAAALDAGKEIAADELPLIVMGPSGETERLARDQGLLNRIAERSGGEVVELSSLGRLVDQLVERYRNPAQDNPQGQTHRLYHLPSLFGLFVVLMTAEWLLRRRWQLH